MFHKHTVGTRFDIYTFITQSSISGIVHHHWKEIQKREMMTKLFPEPPIVAFQQPKSIKDILVIASHPMSAPATQSVDSRARASFS
jgi:hypothetical protein